MALIPEHLRSGALPKAASDVRTVADLEVALIDYVENFSGSQPPRLVDLSRRYARPARALGTSVKDVCARLASEGRLAMHFFSGLNRAYVFSVSDWSMLMSQAQSGEDPFAAFERVVLATERTVAKSSTD